MMLLEMRCSTIWSLPAARLPIMRRQAMTCRLFWLLRHNDNNFLTAYICTNNSWFLFLRSMLCTSAKMQSVRTSGSVMGLFWLMRQARYLTAT